MNIKSKLLHIKRNGFSIVELMVALGILSIIGFAITSIIINSNREMKAIEQKADALSIRSTVEGTLSNLPVCSCNLNSNASSFDASSLATANSSISVIKSSCIVGASVVIAENTLVTGTQLQVANINIENIEALGAADNYKGKMKISFNHNANNIRQIKPITLNMHFKTDPTTPSTAKKITECSFVAGTSGGNMQLSGSCPAGQYLRGIENGEMICSAVTVVVPPGGGEVASNDNTSSGTSYSITNPGPGCVGHYCKTRDYGPCVGHYCSTNGCSCTGTYCTASGTGCP